MEYVIWRNNVALTPSNKPLTPIREIRRRGLEELIADSGRLLPAVRTVFLRDWIIPVSPDAWRLEAEGVQRALVGERIVKRPSPEDPPDFGEIERTGRSTLVSLSSAGTSRVNTYCVMLAAIDAAIPPRYCGYGRFGLETGIIWALAVEDMTKEADARDGRE